MLRLLVLLVAAAFAGTVNLNSATESELEALPGIGPSKAAAIIQYRTEHGAFASVDALDDVPGIGASTMANLRPLVSVGDGKTVTAATTTTTSTSTTTSSSSTKSSSAGCPVNINTADASALEGMPGIGSSKATAIVQYRTDHGNFASCDDLDNVNGIGAATLAGLRDCCTIK